MLAYPKGKTGVANKLGYITTAGQDEYFYGWRKSINEELQTQIPEPESPAQLIRSAMRYAVIGGHRWRPLLLISTYEATTPSGGSAVLHAACAIELIHCCTIIIDDLPCVDDNTDLRRGMPPCHAVYGDAVTIYASHLLYAEAERLAGENAARLKADEKSFRNHLATLRERLVAVQELELNLSRGVLAPTDAALLKFYELKSSPFTSAVWMACTLAGLRGHVFESLLAYAKNLGMAYQLTDDILDAEGEPSIMGKPVGKDRAKINYVTQRGVTYAKELARHFQCEAEKALSMVPGDVEMLRALLLNLIKPVLKPMII